MTTTSRAPILLALGEEDINDSVLRFAADEALRQDRPLELVTSWTHRVLEWCPSTC